MQVKTAVHESVLDQIRKAQSTTIRVDAFPDLQHRGQVATVAVLPDQGGWMSSDTKVYETVVSIDGEVEQLKPGMTAVVEIDIAHLSRCRDGARAGDHANRRSDLGVCRAKRRPVRRCVSLGMTNSKFVEVRSGLEEGERIVLNPSAIPGSNRKSTPAEVAYRAAVGRGRLPGPGAQLINRDGHGLAAAASSFTGVHRADVGASPRISMWLTTLQLGIRNLMLHKLRSLLTMLGTILGVGSVISMLAIGEGSKRHAVEQIRQLGAANVIIRSVKPEMDDQASDSGTASGQQVSRVLEYGLKYNDLDRLTAALPNIKRAVPISLVRKNAQYGHYRVANARILGTTPGVFADQESELSGAAAF